MGRYDPDPELLTREVGFLRNYRIEWPIRNWVTNNKPVKFCINIWLAVARQPQYEVTLEQPWQVSESQQPHLAEDTWLCSDAPPLSAPPLPGSHLAPRPVWRRQATDRYCRYCLPTGYCYIASEPKLQRKQQAGHEWPAAAAAMSVERDINNSARRSNKPNDTELETLRLDSSLYH